MCLYGICRFEKCEFFNLACLSPLFLIKQRRWSQFGVNASGTVQVPSFLLCFLLPSATLPAAPFTNCRTSYKSGACRHRSCTRSRGSAPGLLLAWPRHIPTEQPLLGDIPDLGGTSVEVEEPAQTSGNFLPGAEGEGTDVARWKELLLLVVLFQ